MNSKTRFAKNILIVLIGNVVSIVAGVLVGFLIPKVLGVSEYGYYKTFTLYSSYIGILHFGFVDGIYLKFAGKKYEELDCPQFRTFSRFFFLMQAVVSGIFVCVSFALIKTDYFLIVLFVALNIFATNTLSYFEYVGQATMQFKRTSLKSIVRSLLNITSVVVLFLLYKYNGNVITYVIYTIIVLCINYCLALWYVISFRKVVFGKSSGIRNEAGLIKKLFKSGIILLMTNLIAQIVFVVDQQFVNVAFDNDTYSIYAFAYNMIQLITVAASSISVVLFPTLKGFSEETITHNYSRINSYMLMLVSLCLASYYPLILIVDHFLPQYVDSLVVFRIILPGVLISTSISVIKYNCYKTFNVINDYFFKSLIVLVLAIVSDFVVYYVFKNTLSISIVSIFVLLLWYILAESYFVMKYRVKWIKNLLYLVVAIVSFYAISFIPNAFIGMGTYLLCYFAITLLFFFEEIKAFLTSIRNKKQNLSNDEDNK